jgi:hypothetical protein
MVLRRAAADKLPSQKYTFRSFHFPVTSRNDFWLRTCARITLPWLVCGALSFSSTPPVQCAFTTAHLALTGHSSPASTAALSMFFAILISVLINHSSEQPVRALQGKLSLAWLRFLFTSGEEFRCSRCA